MKVIEYPFGVLENVPVKVGDFYVPIDFVILDMAKDSRTQIILGRPFLATNRCKIDIKEGKQTPDVGQHHAELGLFRGCNSSPSTFSYYGCEVVDPNELVSMLEITQNDPSSLDCTLFEAKDLTI